MADMTSGGFLVSQIKQIQDRIFQRLLKEGGVDDLNGPQGRILSVLWQEDNLSISELAERTSLAKTTLTSMLDRMVEKGHIKRVFDEVDRRQIRITLTDRAKILRETYDDISIKIREIFYKGFTEKEILYVDKALERVLENLKNYE